MPLYNASSTIVRQVEADYLTTGEECIPRGSLNSSAVTTSSGFIRLVYFTARKSETTSQVRTYTGGTAAAATPTVCRIGLYLIDAAGDGTLVASTANDTTLFAGGSTAYTRSWSTPYAKIAGLRYAIGALVVTGAATPTFLGTLAAPSGEFAIAPVMSYVYTGLADLPASVVGASGTANGSRPYFAVLP